jgi:hypothetical protein
MTEKDMLTILAFGIPALLFLAGLCAMMGMEVRCTRRNANAADPVFLRKRR